jgi:hypothetical protein
VWSGKGNRRGEGRRAESYLVGLLGFEMGEDGSRFGFGEVDGRHAGRGE